MYTFVVHKKNKTHYEKYINYGYGAGSCVRGMPT